MAIERPRPLTDSERAVLRETLALLLRDIETSGAILPIIQEWEIEELAAAGRSPTWPESLPPRRKPGTTCLDWAERR